MHVDREGPLWHRTDMDEPHRSHSLGGDRQRHEWRCLQGVLLLLLHDLYSAIFED